MITTTKMAITVETTMVLSSSVDDDDDHDEASPPLKQNGWCQPERRENFRLCVPGLTQRAAPGSSYLYRRPWYVDMEIRAKDFSAQSSVRLYETMDVSAREKDETTRSRHVSS